MLAAPAQSYQWYSSTTASNSGGTLISGATGSTFTPLSTTSGTLYYYCVAVDSGCGAPSAVSGAVNIYASTVTITVHGDTAICQGDSVLLSIHYPAGTTYQWQMNSSNITGATDTSLYVHLAGTYSVTTTNAYGCSATGSVSITVNAVPATPVITLNSTFLQSSATSGNQWYFSTNGTTFYVLPGATSQDYTFTVNGYYYVAVIDSNGCVSAPSNIIHVVTVGIVDFKNGNYEVLVYPNPAKDNITVETSVLYNDALILIYNIEGQLLTQQTMQQKKTAIDVSTFDTGVYVLKVKTDNLITVKKFIKE